MTSEVGDLKLEIGGSLNDEKETRCQDGTRGSDPGGLGKLMEELRTADLTKQVSQAGSQFELDSCCEVEFDPRFEFEPEPEFDLGYTEDEGDSVP